MQTIRIFLQLQNEYEIKHEDTITYVAEKEMVKPTRLWAKRKQETIFITSTESEYGYLDKIFNNEFVGKNAGVMDCRLLPLAIEYGCKKTIHDIIHEYDNYFEENNFIRISDFIEISHGITDKKINQIAEKYQNKIAKVLLEEEEEEDTELINDLRCKIIRDILAKNSNRKDIDYNIVFQRLINWYNINHIQHFHAGPIEILSLLLEIDLKKLSGEVLRGIAKIEFISRGDTNYKEIIQEYDKRLEEALEGIKETRKVRTVTVRIPSKPYDRKKK